MMAHLLVSVTKLFTERANNMLFRTPVLAVPRAKNQTGHLSLGERCMNTFSENGNDFVGRLLHEGGVWRRTFFGFSQYQKCLYG